MAATRQEYASGRVPFFRPLNTTDIREFLNSPQELLFVAGVGKNVEDFTAEDIRLFVIHRGVPGEVDPRFRVVGAGRVVRVDDTLEGKGYYFRLEDHIGALLGKPHSWQEEIADLIEVRKLKTPKGFFGPDEKDPLAAVLKRQPHAEFLRDLIMTPVALEEYKRDQEKVVEAFARQGLFPIYLEPALMPLSSEMLQQKLYERYSEILYHIAVTMVSNEAVTREEAGRIIRRGDWIKDPLVERYGLLKDELDRISSQALNLIHAS